MLAVVWVCYLLSGCIGRVAGALVVGAALKDHGSLCQVAERVAARQREVLVLGRTARLAGGQDFIHHQLSYKHAST